MTELNPNGGLAAILKEHQEKKAQLEQEAAALRDLAATTLAPTSTESAPLPAPGPLTSEGQRTKWQQIAGYFLTAIGGSIATYGADNGNALLATIGTILATAGAAMSGHAVQTYTKSRDTQKTGGAR